MKSALYSTQGPDNNSEMCFSPEKPKRDRRMPLSLSVQGISFKPNYLVPKTQQSNNEVHTFFSKEPKKNMIEVEAERKKKIPAPNQYQRPLSWSKMNFNNNFQKFLKGDRNSHID